ncbi:zinc ribbon domain-containing protein [Frankia sp. CiP3]|uniref:zinc ribbon domain-containing protein n=1 Tax=Frankia sp. CiP3 TaxID=2880971 RepID=UPI001EF5E7A5|nr:zinc ribbon domain-containing protein [Frankia sp. CiP3]
MSVVFDGSGYRQRVLAELQRRSNLDLEDPFFVAALDPAVVYTEAEVRAHLARVIAFLQRQRNSARYATLAAALVRRRAEWEAPLLDAHSREQARLRVLAARRSGDAERLAKVARNLATVRERFGGVPRSRIAGLRRLASADGVTTEQFDAILAGEKVIEDGSGDEAEPLAPGLRRQIRDRLIELRQLRDGDRAGTASLWALLGVPADSVPARIQAAYDLLVEGNQRRPLDREKTVTADLLAQVRTRLLDGDPAAYTAGLIADARDEIRPKVEEHVVLDGELGPAAFEGLVREVLAAGRGLSAAQAKAVLLGIARELGAAVTTGAVVDYVVCPCCSRPEPVDGSRVCRYCDAELYTACPSCGRATEAAAAACRFCGHSLRQAREAADALAAIRRDLENGHPKHAGELLAEARSVLVAVGGQAARAAEDLDARLRAALAAADAGWRALVEYREARCEDAAADGARWLVAQASDVPGPDGRSADEVLAELTAHQEVIRRRVDAARALPPAEQENALAAVLATVADSRAALAALAALPLPPPTELTASSEDGAVVLRWRASPSALGPVSYRVVRLVGETGGPGGAAPVERSLGTTRSTELSDAGAPAGVMVRHEVTAIVGSRRSVAVRTPGIVVVRDVAGLHAEQTGADVRLSWRLDGPVDAVTIDRTVDESSPVLVPMRRIRASAGQYVDTAVQAGVTYRYWVYVEYRDVDGQPSRTAGSGITITVTPRPPLVRDLAVTTVNGQTALRWSSMPDTHVRIYAVPAAGPGSASPVGAEGAEIDLANIAERARLVGSSGDGHLVDPLAVGELEYTPVAVRDGRAVAGRGVRHLVVERIRELRADDRGEEIVLSFQLPSGITEARVLWRRDQFPTGPDDPSAFQAKVTNASLEIKGGWHLAAPRDGSPYFVACYPLVRTGGTLRVAALGTAVVARSAAQHEPHEPHEPHDRNGYHDHHDREMTVTYTLARSGWRRRTLRVQISADGPLPAMVLVARPGTTPPQANEDGHPLARVSAVPATAARTLEVSLEGAELPWGVRLFLSSPENAAAAAAAAAAVGGIPGDRAPTGVILRHPPDEALIVR